MSTNKHPIEPQELMAYLDGELSTDRATAAVSHLERCPDCQNLAVDLRGVSQRLMAWEVEAPDPRISSEVIAALEQRQQKSERAEAGSPTFRKKVMMRRWAWAGAFAILCVALGLGIKLSTPRMLARQKVATQLAEPGELGGAGGGGGGADSNGLFHGMGDHAQSSFNVDGQLLTDQQSKVAGVVAGPMIVRTAGITITTKDFDNARASLDDILRRHHGYIGELTVNTPTGSGRSFSAILRIPADQLDAAMADLRKLGRVEAESQSGQEVTAQYVDLEARLANARNTEKRLTDLLSQRTGKLSDVLAVETEIDRVRGEIERMEAERKNLANQVAFAAINATVSEDYRAQLQVVPVSTSGRMRNAAVEGYRSMIEGVVSVVLFLFSYGPSLLLWGAILFFPARAAWRKGQRVFAR
jgi:hypothetical protein